LKGEVQVDQSEHSPTILVSSSGWAPAGEGTINSEDRVAWNFKVPRAGEISLLGEAPYCTNWRKERNRVRYDGMRRGHLSSIEECGGNSSRWRGSIIGRGRRGGLEWSGWEAISWRVCALNE